MRLVTLLMVLFSSSTLFAQTKFTPNTVVEVPAGHSADIAVSGQPDGSGILFKISPAPLWKAPGLDARTIFNGEAGKSYTLDAQYFTYNEAKKKVEVREESLTVVFLKSGSSPVPPKEPPPDVPGPELKTFYFVVVRANGPADPAFTKLMADPAWATLRGRGHSVKDKTLAEATAFGLDVSSTPCVVTLQVSADGKNTTVYRTAVPLPVDSAGIIKLAEGGK